MQNSSGQSNRLAETIKWIEFNEEQRRVGVKKVEEKAPAGKVIKFSKTKWSIRRRRKVIVRLEEQTVKGTKKPKGIGEVIPLTDTDKNRIRRELETLKLRV